MTDENNIVTILSRRRAGIEAPEQVGITTQGQILDPRSAQSFRHQKVIRRMREHTVVIRHAAKSELGAQCTGVQVGCLPGKHSASEALFNALDGLWKQVLAVGDKREIDWLGGLV